MKKSHVTIKKIIKFMKANTDLTYKVCKELLLASEQVYRFHARTISIKNLGTHYDNFP